MHCFCLQCRHYKQLASHVVCIPHPAIAGPFTELAMRQGREGLRHAMQVRPAAVSPHDVHAQMDALDLAWVTTVHEARRRIACGALEFDILTDNDTYRQIVIADGRAGAGVGHNGAQGAGGRVARCAHVPGALAPAAAFPPPLLHRCACRTDTWTPPRASRALISMPGLARWQSQLESSA